MNNTINTLSISYLRQNATAVINAVVNNQEPAIILSRSNPKAVIVDVQYFQALEEAVMDLTDAKEAEKAKKEPKTPLSSYIRKRFGHSL